MQSNRQIVVYIGLDLRESVATDVAAHSIRSHTNTPVDINYLNHLSLRKSGHLLRPWLVDGRTGIFKDLIDGKPFSAEYSHSRFLVPALSNFNGWVLYIDGDTIFLSDIKKLFMLCEDKYAVMCVKHRYQNETNVVSLTGRLKNRYPRKNWSSLMLINCSHPANKALAIQNVNILSGEYLHSLSWLQEHEIGSLPMSYNYISGVSPKLKPEEKPDSIHYTEGGPWDESKKDVAYASLWVKEYEEWCRNGEYGGKINSMPKTTYDRAL